MAKLSQLQQAYANPRVRKYLDFIAEAEGVQHGYNTLFGNQRFNNLGAHPNVRKAFKQTDGATNYTTAAGRYQFLNGTWNNLAKQYGFRDFSPQSQDLGAIALLAQNGALPYILKGDFSTAIQKSGRTWASLPSSTYKQGKRSWDFVNKHLGSNIQQQLQGYQSQPIGKISASQLEGILKPKAPQPIGKISAEQLIGLTSGSKQAGSISAMELQKILSGG